MMLPADLALVWDKGQHTRCIVRTHVDVFVCLVYVCYP